MLNCADLDASANAPRVIDLFCGAGGFSLAAWWAGFRVVASVDIDPDLTSSYARNFPETRLIPADLRHADVLSRIASDDDPPIEGIVGGPPCQGISEIGRRDVGDLRNGLVVRFFDCVARVRPSFFVMENVPGLASEPYAPLLDAALSRIPDKYELLPLMLLNAKHFGVATSRKRLIVAGYDPRRVAKIVPESFNPPSYASEVSVRDAILDLPEADFVDEKCALPYRSIEPLSDYARLLRQPPNCGLGNAHSLRLSCESLVTGNSRTRHSAKVQARFSLVQPGGHDRISRYRRLEWDRPAPVLRAGTGKDRGSYQAARPIHPASDRVITVREAARIQGFPDWFEFSGTKWHSHRMIGNSISPLFAASLLSVFRNHME